MRLKTSTSPAPSFERQFLAEERGTMTTFTLFIFIIMIMVGGVAVDLMHFESERIRMQNTLDSAILAAADRDQDLSPKAVVMDYFDKAGLGDYISESDITVDQDTAVTYRTVSATASQTINTHFMKMTGIDTLDVPSSGTATESIGDLEISLVLDVSGSMKGTKIANLRSAAEQFVTKILAQSEDDTTSFSIVPYSTQVNVGSELLAQYTVNDAHNYSHCVNFDEDDFQSLSLSTSDALDQTAPTDGWYEWRKDSTDWDDRYETCMVSVWDTSITDPVTNTLGADTSREVIAFESDETVLHNYISTLPAYGNTSIDIGVKWGVTLLDPDTRDVVSNLLDDEDHPFEGRPFDYDYVYGNKILVVMTDGIHTSQPVLDDSLRSGLSPIYVNNNDGEFSVVDYGNSSSSDDDTYWWSYDDDWHDLPYGEPATIKTTDWDRQRVCRYYPGYGNYCRWEYVEVIEEVPVVGIAEQYNYVDLFANYSQEYVENEIMDDAYGNGSSEGNVYSTNNSMEFVGTSTKNTRLKNICDAAKDGDKITIYAIGYEVTTDSKLVMQDCASTINHYFDVDDSEPGNTIEDAFGTIATSINKLKLIQ